MGKMSEGALALRKWLEGTGKTQGDLADDLKVMRQQVVHWVNGHRRPNHDNRLRIQEYTKGAVDRDLWSEEI